jgi:hypothetical protein
VVQLPRVVVLDPTLTGAIALRELADGGLDVTGVGQVTPAAMRVLTDFGLTDRWVTGSAGPADQDAAAVMAACHPTVSRIGGAGTAVPGFAVSLDGHLLGTWDAVVVTRRTVDVVADVISTGAPWYGGVFHPQADGVYLVGPDEVDAGRVDLDSGEITVPQARWVGEYLRGRYLLPAFQAMLDHPGLQRRGLRRGYTRALDRELRAGHARASAAGYPLPLFAGRTTTA